MKRFVSCMVIVVMVLGILLTGCGGQAAQQPAGSTGASTASGSSVVSGETTKELGTFPLTDTKTEFSILLPWKYEKPIEENWSTIEYEKKTNVHINWQSVPADGWIEKRAIIIASGNLPDAIAAGGLFGNSTFTETEVNQYGSQGVFIPLQDLIEKNSIYMKKYLDENPITKKYITSLDGNIYSLFDVNECYHCNYSQKGWINSTWLKNLGLEMPKTTEDLKKVLIAFKTQDPNKNSKKDEIPLSTSVDGWRTNIDGFLMNAFIYTDTDQRLNLGPDGKLLFAPSQDGYREGLKYLTDLYKEGLIAPESFTQSSQVLAQTNESGKESRIGVGFGGVNFLVSGQAVSEKWKEYDAIPPLQGPGGVQTTAYYGKAAPAGIGMFVITKAAKDPALIIRWIDWLYSEDGRNFDDMGLEGRDWKKGDPGDLDFNGNPAKFVPIVSFDDLTKNNIIWTQAFPTIRDAGYREGKKVLSQDWREGQGDMELMLFQASKKYEPFAPKADQVVPNISALPDKVTDYSLLKTSLETYVKESVARFVTGDLNVDKDWDSYIKKLNELGLQKYLDICQEGYEAKYKK